MQYKIPSNVAEIILESISDGVFTVDHEWRITSFNRAAEMITGIQRNDALGKHCWEVFRSRVCESDCSLRRTMKQGKAFVDTTTYIVNSETCRVPVVVCTSLLKDENGTVLGGVETFRDMSVLEELRKELEGRYQVGDMVSHSPLMNRIFNIMPQVAESDSTVLIQGETGTGKDPPARAMHELSFRKKNRLSPSTAAHYRTRCWNRNFSDTRPVPLPAPSGTNRAILRWPRAALSSSMKSANSARHSKFGFYASFRNGHTSPWAAGDLSRSTFESLPRRIRILPP